MPLPHVTEHEFQEPQSDTSQSTGHAPKSHGCVSLMWLHVEPPLALLSVGDRALTCVPASHVVEQPDHCDQPVSWQSTGHACAEHARVSSRCAHGAPLYCGDTLTARDRCCEPPSHVALQAVHWPQAATTQSSGHSAALHVCTSDRNGQAYPPLEACVATLRDRVCAPPPHVVVHVSQPLHCVTTQCAGHTPSSQDCVSVMSGHAAPV